MMPKRKHTTAKQRAAAKRNLALARRNRHRQKLFGKIAAAPVRSKQRRFLHTALEHKPKGKSRRKKRATGRKTYR
jgi:hypothetical protein